MKIKKATDYSIRILVFLSSLDGQTTASDISKILDIPLNHLSKLIQVLSRKGYIITKKGRGGGLFLADNPENIKLSSIIDDMEGSIALSDCILHKKVCRFSEKCKVRKFFTKMKSNIYKFLENITLLDLSGSHI